ncbi:hypothetical protein GCM10028807_18590 [Spirosoma daeguense]
MKQNEQVTQFLDPLNHPFRKEIDALRLIILEANDLLTENIKWNGPNYSAGTDDRITMKIHPPKQIQLIFHQGVKVQEPRNEKLLTEDYGLLVWKTNDRAVATFRDMDSIVTAKDKLTKLVQDWLGATL